MFYEAIMLTFAAELNEIRKTSNNTYLKQANLGILLCQKTLNTLKTYLQSHNFEASHQEINFFKNIKVKPMRHLIYFIEVRSCEIQIPKIGKNYQDKFLNQQLRKTNEFFEKNTEIVLYKNQDCTHFDEYYFTREHQQPLYFENSYFYLNDPVFNTYCDVLWAKIEGFYLYMDYLKERKKQVKNSHINSLTDSYNKHSLEWVSSKAAAVELIYALHSSNLIKQKYGIKDVAKTFEQAFNIDLGDYYHTFSEIRSRKVNRTKLLDTLKENLIKKMDENDE